MFAVFALLVAAPDPALAALLPCTAGLSIEYLIEPKDPSQKSSRMIETVRGPGREPNTCVLDRRTVSASGREEKDAWVREHLEDRITNAGWLGQPLALRPPLLIAPVQAKKHWHFNTTEYEVADVGDTYDVPAGTFEGCVRVSERSTDGQHEAYSVYAPGVGLIAFETKDRRGRATRVERASGVEVKASPQSKKSLKPSR